MPQTRQLSLDHAKGLKESLSKKFLSKKPIQVDCSHVERASVGCVQVLLAAQQKAAKENIPFDVVMSDAFRAVLEDLGIQSLFTKQGE